MTIEAWEFGGVVLAHGLAVASPGPDFALVLRQSLGRGRAAAVAGAVGIGCGILVHVSYSVWGLGLLLAQSPQFLVILKYLGAGYLAWLGVGALRAEPAPTHREGPPVPQRRQRTAAWTQGFLTNILNLKASLFFMALFAAISADTPKLVQLVYGVWMVLATTAWFALVALFFTRIEVRTAFLRWGKWWDRATGIVFIGFALSLACFDLS